MKNIAQSDIQGLLAQLGITRNYKGYRMLVCAVTLSLEDPERLLMITKSLYPDVAKEFSTQPHNVERNIRTIIECVWSNNRSGISELLGSAAQRPSVGQFIGLLIQQLENGNPAA